MAMFKAEGLSELALSMQEAAELPEDMICEIVETQAADAKAAVQSFGSQYQIRRTGETLRHITARKPRRNKSGDIGCLLTFQGKDKEGVRYGEIAFINNYGKRGQAARPFFTDGLAAVDQANTETARRIFDDWLKSKNL